MWLVNLGSKGTAKVKANQPKYFGVADGLLGNSILRTSLSVLKGLQSFSAPSFKDTKFFVDVVRVKG